MHVCSMQSENLRNLKIALHILRILTVTRAQSQDHVICMPNLHISMNFDAVMPDSE